MKANLVIKNYLKVAGAAIEAARNEQANQQGPKTSGLDVIGKMAAAAVGAADSELLKQGLPKLGQRPNAPEANDDYLDVLNIDISSMSGRHWRE